MIRSHLIDGIVRILTPENNTAGIGFVVNDGGLILTCAHILRGYKPGDKVPVRFHIAEEQQRNAIIVPEYWRDPDAEDVAILRLEGDLPDGVRTLGLIPICVLRDVSQMREVSHRTEMLRIVF